MNCQFWIRKSTGALLCASAVALVGCNHPQAPVAPTPTPSSTAASPAPANSSAQAAVPYTPTDAKQLYQMVAPIALFPDKLVAQVLAGATYPDEITSAYGVVTQNPNLKGANLQTAITQQPWDPSVKGLTAFPSVLDQMAKNIDWTTALGDAYVNDPTDVMNAIQVMRQRASRHGSLHNSPQMHVVTQAVAAPSADDSEGNDAAGDYQPSDNGYAEYDGPNVVPVPQQIIEIQPAQQDTVYVPRYDAQTVYGEEISSYPGYVYEPPRAYSTGELIGVGAVSFGVGVLVGSLFEHHHEHSREDYGWNSWGMRWRDRNPGAGNGPRKQRQWLAAPDSGPQQHPIHLALQHNREPGHQQQHQQQPQRRLQPQQQQ